jgi:hypothetical protein
MNAKVFINYRRKDSAPYAGRLYDRSTARFGENQAFIDIDQIEPGEDFVKVITIGKIFENLSDQMPEKNNELQRGLFVALDQAQKNC